MALDLQRLVGSTGSTRPDCNWTTKFRSQRTSHMESSATSTTVTGPVAERLQAGTEDAPVLGRPVPLRRLHDSAGAGYKYTDLLTYTGRRNRPCNLDLWSFDLKSVPSVTRNSGHLRAIFQVSRAFPSWVKGRHELESKKLHAVIWCLHIRYMAAPGWHRFEFSVESASLNYGTISL